MIQLLTASTLFQAASLAAMLDDGLLGAAERRVLVLANGSQQPELTTAIQDAPGFSSLARRFDAVVDLGALVWPRRPQAFNPREEELGMWESLLRLAWDLGDAPLELVLDSIQVNPAIALARIFHDASVGLHSDGLMAYGPTRNRLRFPIAQRLGFLAYADLVPGLRPVLLREHGIELRPLEPGRLRAVMDELGAAATPSPGLDGLLTSSRPTALLLGQYLVPLGVLDEEEQAELDGSMLQLASRLGAEAVAFKPHPSAAPGSGDRLLGQASELGLHLTVLEDDVPAEVLMGWMSPLAVVSGFSTSLFTATGLYGRPAHAVMTEFVAERLTPYENGNRVPVVLADAVLSGRLPAGDERLQGLVDAVAYAMRAHLHPELAEAAAAFLAAEPELRDRYVKQKRLRALGLPHREDTRGPGRAHRLVHSVVRHPALADRTLEAVNAIRAPGGLACAPRKVAGKVGSHLVTWSKKGQRRP